MGVNKDRKQEEKDKRKKYTGVVKGYSKRLEAI